VKSPWTWKKNLTKNLCKFRACLEQGYSVELRIYDGRKICVNKVLFRPGDEVYDVLELAEGTTENDEQILEPLLKKKKSDVESL
jgi:hypothetical protein